jgi:hypothetical protein
MARKNDAIISYVKKSRMNYIKAIIAVAFFSLVLYFLGLLYFELLIVGEVIMGVLLLVVWLADSSFIRSKERENEEIAVEERQDHLSNFFDDNRN